MNTRKRIAVIDYELCNPKNCNYLCQRICPINRNGKECITHKDNQQPIISEELCIGCEICQNRCPYKAISIINLSVNLGEPIHSFGKNQFRLHGLPTPQPNTVLGFVGRNGIGKTTILKILSGSITPNFNEKEALKEKVIEYYKGKEIQKHFKELYDKKIKVAVKPQNIDLIKTSGSVKELLQKVDEKQELEETAKKLNIQGILDRDSTKLSGGEFQKIAIAATGLKKAQIYFFDEPSSFLDIKERLRVAKYIRELSKEATVIVIEHDLVLLDYLSDYVNLMYGKPKVFGFVSKKKTNREGINTYLEGYSKDENYRFRDYKIDFFGKEKIEKKDREEKIIEWPLIKKRLGEFEFSAEQNCIRKNEIIGIVGPNGIGKTTFMKMLAKEINPDNCELTGRTRIAYKPQYISYDGERFVQELFEGTNLGEIRQTLLKPLELEELLEKKAKHLSGGELQRVSIALCLSKKADLYLLDEPSAYLDVEQRLAVGKTIKGHVDVNDCSALVIDHDLTFIDYLSDKIMFFGGEPTKKGEARGPYPVREGMNNLLEYLEITMRRDKETKRARINKFDSVLDREQKQTKNYYA